MDGSANVPRYVMSVASGVGSDYSGWLYFVYQDGRTSVIFHYAATLASGDLTIRTDTTPQPFPYTGTGPAGPGQAGSTPIGPGMTYHAVVTTHALTLTDCGAYLYWATSRNNGSATSCTFTFNGVTG